MVEKAAKFTRYMTIVPPVSPSIKADVALLTIDVRPRYLARVKTHLGTKTCLGQQMLSNAMEEAQYPAILSYKTESENRQKSKRPLTTTISNIL